jgi:outer membrane immunogenic protein
LLHQLLESVRKRTSTVNFGLTLGEFTMKKYAIALAAVAAFGGQAMAADMAMKARPAPPPVPVANWTGCYVAGSVGYGIYDNEGGPGFFRSPAGVVTVVEAPIDHGGRGWLAGGGGGCDYQFGLGSPGGFFGTGQFVIGLLGDYYWSDMRGTRASVSAVTGIIGGGSARETIDSQWAIGGRIGWLVNPQTLTYFSGGYTEATLNGTGSFLNFAGAPLGINLPGVTAHGYFLGGGVEYQSGWIPNLTWKTEYRVSDYNRIDRNERVIATGLPNGFFNSDRLITQTVMTSLVYRFNWGGPVVAKY